MIRRGRSVRGSFGSEMRRAGGIALILGGAVVVAWGQPTTIDFQASAYATGQTLADKDGWKSWPAYGSNDKMVITAEGSNKFVRVNTSQAVAMDRSVGTIGTKADLKWRWRAVADTGRIIVGPSTGISGDQSGFRGCRAFMSVVDRIWLQNQWYYMRMRVDFTTAKWELYMATQANRSDEQYKEGGNISGSGGMGYVMIKGNPMAAGEVGSIDVDDIVWEEAPLGFTVALSVSPAGGGTTSPATTFVLAGGASQSVTASPNTGYGFQNWISTGPLTIASATSAATTVTMPSSGAGASTLQANFVCLPLTITTNPETPKVIAEGASLSLSISADACPTGGDVTYQWYQDGTIMSGKTSAALSLGSASKTNHHTKQYYCIASQGGNSKQSQSATVYVLTPPSISTDLPATRTVDRGAGLDLTVIAGGDNLTYQWYKNGSPMSGKTSNVLQVASAQASDAGSYYCEIISVYLGKTAGTATSRNVTVTVCDPPSISTQPVPSTVIATGQSFTLQVNATVCVGRTATYQWYQKDAPVDLATSNVFTKSSATKADSGSYYCTVRDGSQSVNSSVVLVKVLKAVTITRQPSKTIMIEGGTAKFTMEAAGDGALTYQWFRSTDQVLSGQTTNVLSLASVTKADSASAYYCIVSNGPSEARTALCTLIVDKYYNPFTMSVRAPSAREVRKAIVTISAIGDLSSFPSSSTPGGAWADNAYVLYQTLGHAADTAGANVVKYTVDQVRIAGGTLVDTIDLAPLPATNDSNYYFSNSILWHNPDYFLVPTQAGKLFVVDTLAPENRLAVKGVYVKPTTSALLVIDSLSTLTDLTDSVIILCSYQSDFSVTFNPMALSAQMLRNKGTERDTVQLMDDQFPGPTQVVYSKWYLVGTNGVAGSHRTSSFNVGWDPPTNPCTALNPQTKSSSRVEVSWTFNGSVIPDSIQILYDTLVGNVRSGTTGFPSVTVAGNAASGLVSGLTKETKYFFGIRVQKDALWSVVGPTVLPSATTPALTCSERPDNTVRIDRTWFDPQNNQILIAWRHDRIQGVEMEWGATYGTDAAVVVDTAVGPKQAYPVASPNDTARISLKGRVSGALYSVCLWMRLVDCLWTLPTDSCRDTATVPFFAFDSVTYFPTDSTIDTVRAFGGKVVLERGDYGVVRPQSDKLLHYNPATLPAGFVRAGIGIQFVAGLQSKPFHVGIRYDLLPADVPESTVRLYRDSGGVYLVEHASFVENGVAWVKTNDLKRPFIALADTMAPRLAFTAQTVLSEPLDAGAPVAYEFNIDDNAANVKWRFAYCPGNHWYGSGTEGTLAGTSTTILQMVHPDSISSHYGLRVQIIITDGVHTLSVNGSRQVRSSKIEDIVTAGKAWTPVRVAGVLDSASFSTACNELSGDTWQYDNKSFRVFRWVGDHATTGSLGRWLEYGNAVKDSFALVPGRVVWVKTRTNKTVDVGGGLTASLSEAFAVTLEPRNWTDVALPYKFDVLLRDVLDYSRTSGANGLLDPDSVGVVHWVKEVDGAEYTGVDIYSPVVTHLEQRRDTAAIKYEQALAAYSFYNPYDQPLTLRVPPIPADASARAGGRFKGKAAAGVAGWSVEVLGWSSESGTLGPLYCGATPAVAAPRYFPMRPGFGESGFGVVDQTSRRVSAHAMVPSNIGEGVAYQLAFYNHGREPVRFVARIGDMKLVPRGMRARLFSAEQSGGAEEVAVAVPAGTTVEGWLAVGTDAYFGRFAPAGLNARLAFLGARPNPFRSRVAVRYSLPARGVREARMSVYDSHGRRVWTVGIPGANRPGPGMVVWDGADRHGRPVAGGIYLLEMTVIEYSRPEQRTFRQKVTLLR